MSQNGRVQENAEKYNKYSGYVMRVVREDTWDDKRSFDDLLGEIVMDRRRNFENFLRMETYVALQIRF